MGILLEMLTSVFFILVLLFIFSQVLFPIIEERRLCPMFRKRGEVQEKLADAKEELETTRLMGEVKKVQHKTHQERSKKL